MSPVKNVPVDLIDPHRALGELVVERPVRAALQMLDEVDVALPSCCQAWIAEQGHRWRTASALNRVTPRATPRR